MRFRGRYRQWLLLLAGLSSPAIFAGTMGDTGPNFSYIPHITIQGGASWASQGSNQHINIDGLIGDQFTVKSGSDVNGLVGAGLYWDVYKARMANFSLGVNAFYLPRTSVNGIVFQEDLFPNLAYQYSVTNWPIYFGGRAEVHNRFTSKVDVTFDAGIGPNIIQARNFNETSLDGVTLPDMIFNNNTSVSFAAMGGVGLKLNNVIGNASVECGYRFMYLGQGRFNKASDQVLNSLNTGNSYANVALCSVTI